MGSYETDFMSDHLLPTPALASAAGGLETYHTGLAKAGAARGVPMQWCMPTAAQVLTTVDKPAVTNGRASVDFACEGPLNTTEGDAHWTPGYMMGIPSLLFWAVGLPPSKDAVWTRKHEAGAPPSCGVRLLSGCDQLWRED